MPHNYTLVTPHYDMEAAYRALVDEFRAAGERPAPWVLDLPSDDFAALIDELRSETAGAGGYSEMVPHSTFWMIDAERTILGVVNLRHTLNERLRDHGGHIGYGVRPSARRRGVATHMLALTLDEARRRRLPRVLLTCQNDNVGSIRVIERNGGVLESESDSQGGHGVRRRYWIDLAE
jgi:predicted acetyltransferase